MNEYTLCYDDNTFRNRQRVGVLARRGPLDCHLINLSFLATLSTMRMIYRLARGSKSQYNNRPKTISISPNNQSVSDGQEKNTQTRRRHVRHTKKCVFVRVGGDEVRKNFLTFPSGFMAKPKNVYN